MKVCFSLLCYPNSFDTAFDNDIYDRKKRQDTDCDKPPGFPERRLNMKFRPLHDRVVVRRIDSEEKTAGGIIIPDTAKEKPQQGEILAVGPGKRDETGKLVALDVREGDQILFGKWSGTEVKIDGQDLLIMKESDAMGILEDPVASMKRAA